MIGAQTAQSNDTPVWRPLADEIVRIIDAAENHYQAGDKKAAKRAVIEAYFGVFESQKMEAAMRTTIGAKHTYLVEKEFGNLRKAIKKQQDLKIIQNIADKIRTAVVRDAAVLDKAGIPARVYDVNQ